MLTTTVRRASPSELCPQAPVARATDRAGSARRPPPRRFFTPSHIRRRPLSDTTGPFGTEQLHDLTTGDGAFAADHVHGAYAEDATFMDAAGAVSDHCVLGQVNWKAYSSHR